LEFSISQAYGHVYKIVNSNLSITSGMEKLIDYCRNHVESSVWNEIQMLDFEDDGLNLKNWLQNNIMTEPPTGEICSLWFGLFDGIYDGCEVCSLYLSGTSYKHDEKDNKVLYLSDDRYSCPRVLRDMSIILKSNGGAVTEIGEYVLYLGYACLVIKNIFKTLDGNILKNLSKPCEIVVGFDSGDYILVDKIDI
jgi:hypothetical protein